MSFQTRAIDACLRDFEAGVIVETHIQDVLTCRNVDVACFEPFLDSEEPEVKMAAARIIAEKGNLDVVVNVAMREEMKQTLLELLSIIGKHGAGIETLAGLISSEDTIIRDAAVEMFRKAGKTDLLLPLAFDPDDNIVRRVKRYINEAG